MKFIPILATTLVSLFWPLAPLTAQTPAHPEYTGSQTCVGCHEAEAESWATSHHAKAWMEPSETTVDGDFEDAEFTHRGRTTRFFQKDGDYFIETTDIRGGPKVLKVVGMGGVYPLQQYLIETELGRLQSLDVAWDQDLKTWYHIYEDQELKPDDGFHWSGPYKNWNARCAECHATGFEKTMIHASAAILVLRQRSASVAKPATDRARLMSLGQNIKLERSKARFPALDQPA